VKWILLAILAQRLPDISNVDYLSLTIDIPFSPRWTIMRLSALVFGLFYVALFATDRVLAEDRSGGSISDQIQGRWEIAVGVNQGRELLPAELEGTYVTVMVNKIVTFDRQENQRYQAVFTVDDTSSPAQITMTTIPDKANENENLSAKKPDDSVALGILKMVSPEKWMLCYALPGGERPTSFESPVGSKLMFFTLVKKNAL
jgi:uncharacterized protein (TIGR03067 family)